MSSTVTEQTNQVVDTVTEIIESKETQTCYQYFKLWIKSLFSWITSITKKKSLEQKQTIKL